MTELDDFRTSPPTTEAVPDEEVGPSARRDAIDPGLEHVEGLLHATRLRNVLRLNAVVSASTGGALLAAGSWFTDVLGVPVLPVRGVGLGLVAFAGALAVTSGARHTALIPAGRVIASADVAWVLASVAAIAAGVFEPAGALLVGGAAIAVGVFAWLEVSGLRQLARSSDVVADGRPPAEAIRVARQVAASPERTWRVVTDHELYGRLAPNLSRVEPTAADGEGLTRRCYDTSGRGWSETCTLWDEGRRFAIAVDTDDYPYPLAEMRGSWWVEPAGPGRTCAGMTFVFRPQPGARGRLFAWVMHAAFPFVLRRILRGWQRAAEQPEAGRRTAASRADRR